MAVAVARLVRPIETRYALALRGVARGIAREYQRRLDPHLSDVARADAKYNPLGGVLDVADAEVHDQIERIVGPLFDRMATGAARANAKAQMMHGIKLGDIRGNSGVITNTETGIQEDIKAARARNIELVENAHRVYARQVRDIFEDDATHGQRVETIKARLLERGNVSESRAELIARDQTLKLNSQVTQTRQMRAGVEEYVWSTSQDERVRDEHAALEGQTFSWLAPPSPGHPGQDFQCRCVALPVIAELDVIFG